MKRAIKRVRRNSNETLAATVDCSHPRGIQPLGNRYMAGECVSTREVGLGAMCVLPDAVILEILALLSETDLMALSCVSRAFYAFCYHDEQWRARVLAAEKEFKYHDTWRQTRLEQLFARTFDASPIKLKNFYSDLLFQPWFCANMALQPSWLSKDNIERRSNLSREEFSKTYEHGNKPVIVTDVVTKWPAFSKWSNEYLLRAFGDTKLEAGPASLSFGDYLSYCSQSNDDLPLYIFDPRFVDKSTAMAGDYAVPDYFSEDLFSVLGARRPDYRWLIIGPERSGSVWHVDPNATSAWNAVIRGCKKWILFPPGCPPPGVHPSPAGDEVTQPVSLREWFFNYYAAARECGREPIECLVREGEIIYVPHGWWHCVINTEYSVAITQNYVGTHNLAEVADFLRLRRGDVSGYGETGEHLFEDFSEALEKVHPGLLATAAAEHEKEQSSKLSGWARAKHDGAQFTFGF